ncbi:LamG domain-containing protein [Phytohabitans sp. LJ34]|uniref:LamG domain-containing protein n=1 Tax=Phytohabitans sp. LJ34 TaxID=3452217 RepID=UPI003F8B2020
MTLFSKRRLGSALCAILAGGFLFAAPASAREPAATACTVPGGGLVAETEDVALALAAECGAEVRIAAYQDYAVRWFAEPDGRVRTEAYAAAQWARDASGQWVDADPTLVPAGDGGFRTAATVSTLRIAGGDGAFVTATAPTGQQVGLDWPGTLPQPRVSGSTAVFDDVMPDVDLEVYADVDGFSYALVVYTAAAAANPALKRIELGLRAAGLTVAADTDSDTAELTDAGGEMVYAVETPWMWDSSTPAAATATATADGNAATTETGLAAAMDLEVDGDTLAVLPDAALLNNPDLRYPLYIDPKFTGKISQWANLHYGTNGQYVNKTTWSGDSYLRVGFQGWQNDNAVGLWRSAIQFNGLDDLKNRVVADAQIWMTQDHTGGCGTSYKVRLGAMDYFKRSTATFANTYPDKYIGLVATTTVPTSNEDQCGDEGDQRFKWQDSHLTNRLKYIVDRGWSTASFTVFSDNEGNRDQWRKLSPSSGRLVIWHTANKPVELSTNGQQCSTSAPGYRLNTLVPSLKATAPSNLASTAELRFELTKAGSSTVLKQINVAVTSNGTKTVAVPTGVLAEGTGYRWRVRVWDSDGDSARHGPYSAYCYFRVNAQPQAPNAMSTEKLGCGAQSSPTMVTTTTPRLIATPRDPDGGKVRLRFELSQPTGAVLSQKTPDGQAGTALSSRVDKSLALTEGVYRWRAQTLDEFGAGPWSAYCWFQIDTTPPEPADVAQVTVDPAPGDAVRFNLVGGGDVAKFKYILAPEAAGGTVSPKSCNNYSCHMTTNATNGKATINVLPSSTTIDHVLQVWAIDAAGNESSRTDTWFANAPTEPVQPVGAWRFDGDTADDLSGAALAVTAGPRYGTDRFGRAGGALEVAGDNTRCAVTGGPPVDTADSFTLAAWVRIDKYGAGAGQTVFGMPGSGGSNVKLLLNGDGTVWYFSRHSQGTGAQAYWNQATAPVSGVSAGGWVHLAGVYDAPAERLRLYVNGALAGSGPVTFDPPTGTGRMGVGCGFGSGPFEAIHGAVDDAVAVQQVLTSGQIAALAATNEGLPAGTRAWWPLRQKYATEQSGHGPQLSTLDSASWVADQHGRAASALAFDGSTCPTAERVPVRTDGSFTASAWVYLDPAHTTGHSRVFSLHGGRHFAAMLKYNPTTARWDFSVTNADDTAATGASVGGAATPGKWTHLAVTVNADTRHIALYVNGALAAGKTIGFALWRAGEMVVGCGGTADGTRSSKWKGAMSDVRVWRGVATPDAIQGLRTEQVAYWELGQEELGTDGWGADHNLAFSGSHRWVEDRYNWCQAAYGLGFDGAGYASTAGPVVTTDQSFTVAAWTQLNSTDGYRTVASQTGANRMAFNVAFHPTIGEGGRFQLSMPSSDGTSSGAWHRVVGAQAPELGRWYHVAGVFDFGTGTMRLYVNGALQGEQRMIASPWQATGPFVVGAAYENGAMVNHMDGVIDQVRVWSGAVDPLVIRDLARRPPDPDGGFCDGDEQTQ